MLREAIQYTTGDDRASMKLVLASLAVKVESDNGELTPDEVRILSVIEVVEGNPDEADSWARSVIRWYPDLQPIVMAITRAAHSSDPDRSATRH